MDGRAAHGVGVDIDATDQRRIGVRNGAEFCAVAQHPRMFTNADIDLSNF